MDATSIESIAVHPLSNPASQNSNTNMSCGSSSSSSNSSGYASATTTPTNPASAGSSNHSQYTDSHSSTPVGMVEPTPVATIAAITPYYNETYQHQQQQQQQHQPPPQHHHNPHPAPHQQYQHHQTHSYQLTEQLQSPSLSQYNSATATYDSSYPYLGSGNESYAPQSTDVERNLLGMRHTTAFYTTTLDKPNRLTPTQMGTQPLSLSQTANTHNSNNHKIYNNNNNSEIRLQSHHKRNGGEINTSAAKPQATATPFYAQPTNANGAYLDPYKNSTKISSHKLTGDNQALDASPYAQNFSPYHGSKMLQDIAYGGASGGAVQTKPSLGPLTNARMSQQRLGGGLHYGNNAGIPIGLTIGNTAVNNGASGSGVDGNGSNSNGAYHDKYVYTAVSAAPPSSYYTSTQPAANFAAVPYNAVSYASAPLPSAPSTIPPQFAAEIPNDAYRKPSAAAAASNSSWHWSVEYANGNCRTLPPPPHTSQLPTAGAAAAAAAATHNGLPTAAIPPTNASSYANATLIANRDIYYTPEKYSNNKYDKYNSYYNPHQQFLTGRNVWPSTPHGSAHLMSAPLTERLPHHLPHHHPYTHHAAAPLPPTGIPSGHPSLAAYHHTYSVAPPPSAASAAARQNCCSQTFQQQNCYYPRTAHHPPPPSFFANTYNPHPSQPPTPYAITGSVAGASNSNNTSTGKYSMLDYGHASKTKVNTNDLYAAAAISTPTYETANFNYHSYPPNVAPPPPPSHNQQQYSNTIVSAVEPPLNANITAGPGPGPGPGTHSDIATAYYNDLNSQPSYENYLSPIQAPALIQQRRESLVQRVEHLPNLSTAYTAQPQTTKTAGTLIDYRKPTGATINDDCFMSSASVTLTNLDEHMATNMSNYDSSSFGEMQLSDDLIYGKTVREEESTEKTGTPTTPTTKIYSSLRDFLSTWNEDEDDYGCAAEFKFVENETHQLVVEQAVRADESDVSHDELATNKIAYTENLPLAVASQPQPSQMIGEPNTTETFHGTPKPQQVSSDEDHLKGGSKVDVDNSMNIATNQCANMNLPDIIIDIEKSSSATAPTLSLAPKTLPIDNANGKSDVKSSVIYNSFDVEKELDELETHKIKLTRINHDIPAKRTGSVIKKVEAETEPRNVQEISTASIIKEREEKNPSVETKCIKTFGAFEYVNTATAHPYILVKNVEESENHALTTAVQAKSNNVYDRVIENENTTSSNSSTFEKEYETFINKIGNEFDVKVSNSNENDIETPDISADIPEKSTTQFETQNITNINKNTCDAELRKDDTITVTKQNSDSDLEIAQKIKSYSKFYKRKRTYSQTKINENNKLILEQKNEINSNTNFPQTYTKSCRKRGNNDSILKIQLKAIKARHTKLYSYYQRRLRTLRRYDTMKWKRLYTKALVKQHIEAATVADHLPLNKRKNMPLDPSTDEYNTKMSYIPKTLKELSISFINSEMYRKTLLKSEELKRRAIENNNSMKNHAEPKTDLPQMKITMCPKETIESQNNLNSSLRSTDKKKYLDDNSSDIAQNNFLHVCKKIKVDSGCAMDSQIDIVENQNEFNKTTVDMINSSFEKNTDVTASNIYETTSENIEESMDLSKADDEKRHEKSLPPLQQQKHEKSPTQTATDGINDETLENVTKITSWEHEVTEISKMAQVYNDTAKILDEIETKNANATLKDVNEATYELNALPNDVEMLDAEIDAVEEFHNEKFERTCEFVDSSNTDALNTIEGYEPEFSKEVLSKPTVQPIAIYHPATDATATKVQDVQCEIMDLTYSANHEQSSINSMTDNIGCFSEDELETISLHLRGLSNQSNSESKLVGFASINENEEVTQSKMETDTTNTQSNNIPEEALPQANGDDVTLKQNQSIDRDFDFSETENSVDMFGARKYAEYFTTASKNYFQKTANYEENSTDSNLSSSSTNSSSSSSSDHRSASSTSSSSSSFSSDEDTQSSTTTVQNDFNEMKELEKELSQHQTKEPSDICLKEEEQKTEAIAVSNIRNNNTNEKNYFADEKTTDNDIKTLKKILECDSDEQEEVKRDHNNVNDNTEQGEKLNVDEKDMRSFEHKKIDAIIMTAQNVDEAIKNEDNNGVVSMPLARRCDCVGSDAVGEVLETNEVENNDDENKNAEENHTSTLSYFANSVDVGSEGVVPRLKNIILDFLERENSIENHYTHMINNRTEDVLNSKIPKLSDLCNNALSSSFEFSNTTNKTNQNASDKLERELSVEEALAEMYRQVGVTSDVDDDDNDNRDTANAEVKDAQDVVVINLEEILVNDSDLYVLQCDMNENVLSVVAHAQTNSLPMIINENIDNIENARNIVEVNDEEGVHVESPQQEVEVLINATTTTKPTDYLSPFMGVVDEGNSMEQVENDMETIYTYANHTPEAHTFEFVDDSLNSQFDFPAIHHEEIVSHDSRRYKRQLLYTSLREKYVLKRVNFRIHHGNRVLKKYIHRWILQCLIARFRERELRKVQQMYVKE